jgi:hypothetical protein
MVSNYDATNGIKIEPVAKEFLYPNPAKDILFFRTAHAANSVIVIYNLQSREVLHSQVSEPIDISNFSEGVFIAKLIEEGKVMVTKLIVE